VMKMLRIVFDYIARDLVDLQAPISFFDMTPVGRILNRFSSDVFSIDDTLPFILNIFLAQSFSLLGVLVICCYGLPYIALLVAPLTVIYYFIQVSYCCFRAAVLIVCSSGLAHLSVHAFVHFICAVK